MCNVFSPLSAKPVISPFRLLSVLLVCLYCLVAPLLSQEPEERPVGARQNPVLRSFFRQEFLSFHSRRSAHTFIERYVDRRIDHFLQESRRRLSEMQQAYHHCRRLGEVLLEQVEESKLTRSIQQEYWEAFQDLGKKAYGLRKQLSLVFPRSLKDKSDFEAEIDGSGGNLWMSRELAQIRERMLLVEEQLESYLFENRPVVDADDLAERDLLVLLYEIRQLSRAAKSRLEAQ